MALKRTTFIVWHNQDHVVDASELIDILDNADGVEYTFLADQVDSGATYDQERGTYVIPTTEIPDGGRID